MLKRKRGIWGLLMGAIMLMGCSQNEPSKEVVQRPNVVTETSTKAKEEENEEEAPVKLERYEVKECPVEIIDLFAKQAISNEDVLNITLKNIGESAVARFTAYVVFWDEEGNPLRVNFGRDKVSEITHHGSYLRMGTTDTWAFHVFLDGKTFDKAEVHIAKVELYSGGVYENVNAKEEAEKRFKQIKI